MKKEWYTAMELGNIVREFLNYDSAGRTEFAEHFAQERLGKGKRTLYRRSSPLYRADERGFGIFAYRTRKGPFPRL